MAPPESEGCPARWVPGPPGRPAGLPGPPGRCVRPVTGEKRGVPTQEGILIDSDDDPITEVTSTQKSFPTPTSLPAQQVTRPGVFRIRFRRSPARRLPAHTQHCVMHTSVPLTIHTTSVAHHYTSSAMEDAVYMSQPFYWVR